MKYTLLKPKILLSDLDAGRNFRRTFRKRSFRNFEKNHLDMNQIEALVSIDLKKEEPAVVSLAEKYKVPFFDIFGGNAQRGGRSLICIFFCQKITGIDNVCERAAVTYCKKHCEYFELIAGKSIETAMTAAIARRNI